jgi:hypothetical protein
MEKRFLKYKDTPKYITNLSRENRIAPTAQEEQLWSAISNILKRLYARLWRIPKLEIL